MRVCDFIIFEIPILTVEMRGVGRGVSLGSGNPLQVQYITQLGEITPVILQMI